MMSFLKRLWNNEFYQGGIYLTVSSFLVNILNYFFNLVTGRALGPIGFGEITTLLSYTTIFSVPILVVSMIIIEKLGAKGRERFNFAKDLEKWFLSKIKRWWFLIFLALLFSPFVPRITNLSTFSSYFLIPLIILAFLGAFYGALGQGLRLFFEFSVVSIIAVAVKLAGGILALLGIGRLNIVVIFILLSSIYGLLEYRRVIIKRVLRVANHANRMLDKRIINVVTNPQFVLIFISVLALIVLNNFDVIFVKKFFSAQDAGIYAAWSLFAKIILYSVGPIFSIAYIFFTSKENQIFHEKTLNISLIVLAAITLISYSFYSYFSAFIINIFFGNKFISVAPYLGRASIFGSLYAGITFLNNYFLAKKSGFGLILPVSLPFYIVGLFLIPKKLGVLIELNIIFAVLALLLYLIAYARIFFYNSADGKIKR